MGASLLVAGICSGHMWGGDWITLAHNSLLSHVLRPTIYDNKSPISTCEPSWQFLNNIGGSVAGLSCVIVVIILCRFQWTLKRRVRPGMIIQIYRLRGRKFAPFYDRVSEQEEVEAAKEMSTTGHHLVQ